jgi:hypothetical protein
MAFIVVNLTEEEMDKLTGLDEKEEATKIEDQLNEQERAILQFLIDWIQVTDSPDRALLIIRYMELLMIAKKRMYDKLGVDTPLPDPTK